MNRENQKKNKVTRRGFIKRSAAAAAGLGGLAKTGLFAGGQAEDTSELKIREYRTLGRTGFKVSDIGFGAGYLSNANVLAAALDAGLNYIDTAEHYARGNSERTIGEAMKNRDRKSVFITSKLNFGMGGSSKEKLKIRMNKCLERLQMDYVDCLMIHMTPTVQQIKNEDYHEAIRELKAEGKVRFTGLSNHGADNSLDGWTKSSMDEVVLAAAEDGRFDVVLFTYNFIQREKGERILKICKEKNMGTTLMKTNPVKSYLETKQRMDATLKRGRKIPELYLEMLNGYKARYEKAQEFLKKYGLSGPEQARDAAIKFTLSHPDVHSVCPTMNSFDDLDAYLPLSGKRLEPVEKAMLSDYEDLYGRYYCRHACGECESSCPHGVPVNTIMRYEHYFTAQRREKQAMEKYSLIKGKNASVCLDCAGHCERACPFGVPIQGLLMLAHQALSLDPLSV
jgi:predicted aldo/keto reductase-like oxidoreductase